MRRTKLDNHSVIAPQTLKTLEIDIEKGIFKINGEDFGKGCQSVKIVCNPPEWRFRVIINRPIEFYTEYDLKGKEKNRALYELEHGKNFRE